MSMPQFPPVDSILSRDEAINAILTSIAMEETALSHIINAEGEKIQYILEHMNPDNCCKTTCCILKVNDSATSMLEQIADLQLILKNKMRIAERLISEEYTCSDTHSHHKPEKLPCPPRTSIPCPPKKEKP